MRVSYSSQLTIPDLGLGCMGMSEFYGETNATDCEETLAKAVEIGITHFDTADIYGQGENEKLIGNFLKKNNCRSKITIATKCGIKRDPNDPASRIIDNSEKYIYESCLKSIERLGTHIDLFYLHRIADEGKNIESSMNAMALLLREGKIKHVGISEATAEQIKRAHNSILKLTDGKQGLAAVQTEYSMMSRGAKSNNTLISAKNLAFFSLLIVLSVADFCLAI
ncbi:aldo/keto reductase [Fluviispira vulneris]|uniref:aldo/keto reductase n=1 Tax=Fluviispira vulneris TaxID=2763012 RepID=UPI001645BF15|nr:aldo/keto reductase [Fluviispira vulneris]